MKTLLLFPLFFLSPLTAATRSECSSDCSLATAHPTATAPRADADTAAKKNPVGPAAPRPATPKPSRPAHLNYLFM
jgi:hypothetical protein